MSTQLQIDGDADGLVQILESDGGIHGTGLLDDFAYAVHRLHSEHAASAFVETTEDDVIVTIKIPRT